MIDWDLRPLAGFGPLDFGMTPAEVDRLLGPARSERTHSPNDYRQSRGKGVKGYDVILGFDPKALTDGTFPSQPNEITVLGLKVFHTDPSRLVAALKQANGGSYAVYHQDLFAFKQLGIVLSDWMDIDSSDRWIAAGSGEGYKIMTGTSDPDEVVN